jgi:N-acetylglucosaminyldiphosphoundecaprenol N-acetyl-beta-D-mannosaminyltransferase
VNDYRTDFIGYPVDNISLMELLNFVNNAIIHHEKHFIAVMNANKMYLSSKNNNVKNAISSASIILPENSINIGMRLLKKPLKTRNMGGIHTMESLLNYCNTMNLNVYFLGSTEFVLNKMINVIIKSYQNLMISGFRNGFFEENEEIDIIKEINNKSPNFLFIGLGSPKQELFISKYINIIKANVILGVGGSFKVFAGIEKPAPKWTKFGFEWLYRTIYDPSKFKRYIVINSFYLISLIKYIFKKFF